jgi:polyisoprenoid-binding protein YceI
LRSQVYTTKEDTLSTITATPTQLPTGTWAIDPVHSQVGFAVDYMVGTFRGSFSPVEGALAVAEDGGAELKGSAAASSIKVQDESLSTHLLSPDFFDAERTPEIRFSATDVRRSGNEVTVKGELTIKGITEPVELTGTISDPVRDAYGNDRIGLTLETIVDRTRFGVNWNLALPNGKPALANDVTLTAELYLVKA